MRTPTPGIDGFTVLELLAVMVVLALAATAFTLGAGRSSFGSSQFRALILETTAAAKQARNAAIRRARDQALVLDLADRTIRYPGADRSIAIPREVDLGVVVAESERYGNGTMGIRFLPNGGSTGGTLTYSWRSMRYVVHVNWLTGGVSITAG